MKSTFITSTVAGLLCFSLISCEPTVRKDETEDRRMEVRGEMTEDEARFHRELRGEREELERRTQDYNRRLADIKNQQSAPEDNTSTNTNSGTNNRTAAVEDLEERNNNLQNRLDDFTVESEESWQEFKKDFNDEMAQLENEINKFFSTDEADDQAENRSR